jgi:hypothetical protein
MQLQYRGLVYSIDRPTAPTATISLDSPFKMQYRGVAIPSQSQGLLKSSLAAIAPSTTLQYRGISYATAI